MKLKSILIIMPTPIGKYVFSNNGKRLEYTSEYFDKLYAILKETVESFDSNIECKRSYSNVTKISFEIIRDIASVDLALAVVTCRNSNVFWQLGVRNALSRGTIILQDREDQSSLGLVGGYSSFEYSIDDSANIDNLKRYLINQLYVYQQVPAEQSIIHKILGNDWYDSFKCGANKNDLFISYTSNYFNEADTIKKKAQKNGLTVFLDKRSIGFGEEFGEEIRQNLLKSNELCLLITPDALKSEWVATEWGAAWALNKRITPVLLRCNVDQLPDRLRIYQSVDFHDIDKYINQIKTRKEYNIKKS